jgi:general secretion pathway protein G
MTHKIQDKSGFTFVEVMVVVAIIGVLAALVTSAIQYVRVSGRDARRVSDISQIRSALNLYYSRYSQYPTEITPGQQFAVNNTTYLDIVPSNPQPYGDHVECSDSAIDNYDYTQRNGGLSYTLTFCLGYKQDDIQAGLNVAVPEAIIPQ